METETLYTLVQTYPGRVDNGESRHEHAELAYVIAGDGRYVLDGRSNTVKTGDVVVVAPGCVHREIAGVRGMSLLFVGFMPRQAAQSAHVPTDVLHSTTFPVAYPLRCIVDELRTAAPDHTAMIAHLVCVAVLQLRRCALSTRGSHAPTDARIDDAVAFMRKHVGTDLRVEDLSSRFNLNSNYFSSAFRSKTGLPPLRFLNQLRIDVAKRLIAEGNMPIKQVGETVGYDDPYYFSRVFKRIAGMSPVHYRKRTSRPLTRRTASAVR